MTAALLVGSLLAAIVATAYSVLGDEIRAWIPYLARWLVRSAASHLPAEDRRRYERDWLAELSAWEDRPLSALGKALHIRLRVRGIRESVLGVSFRGERLTRAMDVIAAAALLLFFAPLLAIVAIAIRLDSPGPAFSRSARSGRNGQPFGLIKFRSVYILEQAQAGHLRSRVRFPRTQRPREPHMTPMGRVLRRWSLDELPQLVNVLRGEMSLVGPRPTLFLFKTGEPKIDARNSVRPGLVDPCIVDDSLPLPIDFDEAVDRFSERHIREAAYARSRSFQGDLRLLLRAPLMMLRRRWAARDLER